MQKTAAAPAKKNLSRLTKEQLKAILDQKKIKYGSKVKNQDLIKLINSTENKAEVGELQKGEH